MPSLAYLKNLRSLNLRGNFFTRKFAENIGRILVVLNGLEFLDLANNSLGDEGAKSLAGFLPEMGNLEEIVLDRNEICWEGFEAICKELKGCELKILSVRFNFVDDTAL